MIKNIFSFLFYINYAISLLINFNVYAVGSNFTTLEKNSSLGDTPSLHVLIATTGRESLFKMLDSLELQLESNDFLTIVFDAIDRDNIFDLLENTLVKFECICNVIMEPYNLGFWGHGIRNKYNQLRGDFVLHGDDDDTYLPEAIATIKKEVSKDLNALYVFPMLTIYGCIRGNPMVLGNIGTPMGVIPAYYNSQAKWGYFYGGDFAFYELLSKKVPRIVYVDFPIYKVR